MYQFILNMWILRKVTAEQVQGYVPRYITQEQCNTILATPQGGLDFTGQTLQNRVSVLENAVLEISK